jgi:hypothetical protein
VSCDISLDNTSASYAGVYILENNPHSGRDISRCYLGGKCEKGKKKGRNFKRKIRKGKENRKS